MDLFPEPVLAIGPPVSLRTDVNTGHSSAFVSNSIVNLGPGCETTTVVISSLTGSITVSTGNHLGAGSLLVM